jgi:hypothetical protein
MMSPGFAAAGDAAIASVAPTAAISPAFLT